MPEIKFRGKRLDNGKWVYGYYLQLFYYTGKFLPTFIMPFKHSPDERVEVNPETIEQFTGRKNKSGEEIYARTVTSDRKGKV